MPKLTLTASKQHGRPPSKKKAGGPKEAEMQRSVFDWSKWAVSEHPELELMFAVPNGVPLNGPKRFAVINWLKLQGLKPGVPDMVLPVARGQYHGLFIEMKTDVGELSERQEWWIPSLKAQGYRVEICRSTNEAIAVITEYLEG